VLNENQRSGSLKDDLTTRLFLVFLQRSVGKGLYGRAALATRYASVERHKILASRLQKAATKLAENSSQFAVWSLN
jgi:hypothetical protein